MFQNMSTKLSTGVPPEIQSTSELQSTYVATNVINGVCSFVAVVGNVLMILAILRNSSLRHNPSFVLVFNLAVSDVGVGLITQPLYIALTVMEAEKRFELSNSKLNIAYKSIAGCLASLSFLTITAISFDRFLAVHLKLNYRSVVTVKRMKVIILLLWLVAILSGMVFALDFSIFVVYSAVVFCLCLILTTFNYIAIAGKLYRHSLQLHARNREADSSNHKSFNFGQYKKTLTSMLCVYGAFLICYLPYVCCITIYESIGRTSGSVRIANFVTGTFVLANSAINPCLYYWRIEELRQAVRKLLGLGRSVRSEVRRASTTRSDSML